MVYGHLDDPEGQDIKRGASYLRLRPGEAAADTLQLRTLRQLPLQRLRHQLQFQHMRSIEMPPYAYMHVCICC